MDTVFPQSVADYDLRLSYPKIMDTNLINEYREQTSSVALMGNSVTLNAAKKELRLGLGKMLGEGSLKMDAYLNNATLIVGAKDQLNSTMQNRLAQELEQLGNEGFAIKSMVKKGKKVLVICANADIGILYGVFRFLALMEQHQDLDQISLVDAPKIDLRMLNHWDNLDRTVVCDYAGASIWNWQKLPEYTDPRYIDYARATVLPGDVVLANRHGTIFIPSRLTSELVLSSEIGGLKDLFGFQRLREKKYTPGEIDTKWTDEINDDFKKWLDAYPDDKLPMTRKELQEYLHAEQH
jgi:alpha-glucuronidase